VAACAVACASIAVGPGDAPRALAPAAPAAAAQEPPPNAPLPLAFEANRGQAPEGVGFVARGRGYSAFLTPSAAILALVRDGGDTTAVETRLRGARGNAPMSGEQRLGGRANYLIGDDPKRWSTGTPTYRAVRTRDAYRGIDVVFHGDGAALDEVAPAGGEHEVAAARWPRPGASPARAARPSSSAATTVRARW
jgi:hypothetical protein